MCWKLNDPITLQIAKHNVSKYYPVVGVLELFNRTLSVLERKLPQFFEGAVHSYYNDPFFKNYEFRNLESKKHVSEEIKDTIRRNLTNEIEFYEFCKQRLQWQYRHM